MWFGLLLGLFVFLSLAGYAEATTSAAATARVRNSTIGSRFAIADFDGDVRPDFASVEAELSHSGSTNYWIQLQLSAAGRQSISLVAPAGGLTIQARDVNGDHAMDLVLATAWFKQPVAILLNDGHGNFSRVDPTEFPGAFNSPGRDWSSAAAQNTDLFGLPSQTRSGICRRAKGFFDGRLATALVCGRTGSFFDNLSRASYTGRAPPSHTLSL